MTIEPSSSARSTTTAPIPLVVISGPTAGGKSSFAVDLASLIQGEIINIDSVQAYKGTSIGAATPEETLRARVPHHLFGTEALFPGLTARRWVTQVTRVAQEVHSREGVPLVTGSSGLYISHLLGDAHELPEGSEELRRDRLAGRTIDSLYEELRTVDPERAALLHPHDRQRIERSLEIFYLTGKAHSAWCKEPSSLQRPACGLVIVLLVERAPLYAAIEERAASMWRRGLLNEVSALTQEAELQAGHDEAPPLFEALGYRHARQVILGQVSQQEAQEALARETRRYAKRQITYWNNEPRKRGWKTSFVVPDAAGSPLLSESGDCWTSEAITSPQFWDIFSILVRERVRSLQGTTEVWYLPLTGPFPGVPSVEGVS